MKQKAKRILVVMLTVMIIFGYLAPLVADEANAATADLDLCDLGCELEHCDGDHCDGGHYDEENCDWGHCDEEICDGVICDGDNCDGDCYSEHCGDCECENGHCDEQCDSIGVVEVSSSSSVGRMTKEQAACSHVWNISAATCTVQKWCKKCGYVAQKALGHSTVYKETKAATCTTQGTYVYTCTRSGCGYSTGGYIPSLGHKAGAAATCTSPQKCTRCGVTLKDKLGHSYGAAATCTTAQKCTRCGVTLKNALGHSAGAAATCTTAQKCTRCGVTLKNALGHDAPYKQTKAPTCTTQGEYVYKCTRCSYSTGGYIPALGHSAGAAATCTAPQKCTRCSTVINNALGHAWDNGTVTKAATCTATGVKTFKCSRCGGTRTETINALGHSAGAAATCTAPQKCTRCNVVLANALGHAWDNGTVTKAATCMATGVKTKKCTRCSATTTEEIPKAAHNCEWRITVQPSCKGSGTEQYTCKVCGTGTAWRSIQYYGDHTWVAATCTKAKTCSVCDATSGDPLGHAYAWRTTVDATCTTTGKRERYCTRTGCGHVVARQDIAALGHNWDDGTITTQPTCTSKGVKTFNCTNPGCSMTKTEVVNEIPHNGSWSLKYAPTCAGSGTEVYTCSSCGKETGFRSVQYYGDHTWKLEPFVGAVGTSEGYETYRCSVCDATKTEAHNYQWETTAPHDCVPGKQEYKCTKCGHVRDGRSIQAYGDHTWQLKEKDETFCTCTCEICGIEVTREHFYNKTVVLEASEYFEGKLLCKCVFCGDEYTEVIPRLKKTKITYHWNQAGYADTVESYFSLDDNLLSVAVPSDLVVDESFVLLGWCIRNNADVILTDVNKVQDVVSELGNSAELYAVWEKTSGWTYYCDARGHLQMKKLGSKVNWENGDLVPTKNKTFVSFTYASSNEENVAIETHEDWVHIEAVSGGYWIVIDPCFDAISESDNSAAFRRTEVSLSVADNTGKREKIRIAVAQYRPKGYIDSTGKAVTKNQLHNEYLDYVNKGGTLSESDYFNTNGSGIRMSASGNNAFFLFHREDPFCVKKNGAPSYSINYNNYQDIWLKYEVSYLKLSRNVSETHPTSLKVKLNTAVEIEDIKGDAALKCIVYWLSDLKENVIFTEVYSDYLVEHDNQTFGETLLLCGTNLLGLTTDFLGILAEAYPELNAIAIPASLLSGLADNIAYAYVHDSTEEELNSAIAETFAETGVSVFSTISEDAISGALSKFLAARGVVNHVGGLKQAFTDYWNQPENDQIRFDEGYFRYGRTMAVMDIYPQKDITGEISVSITGTELDSNEGHNWSERMWVYIFDEIYEINWKNMVIQQ